MEWLSLISDISIISASLAAIYGINAWKREFRGKRKIELAEEVRVLFYEAKDVIQAIRSPIGHSEEGLTREKDPNENPEESNIKNR